METDNPQVKRFTAEDHFGDSAEIILGPVIAVIQTSRWPRDDNGVATDIGVSQSIRIPRAELIGIAYEILAAANAPHSPPVYLTQNISGARVPDDPSKGTND